MVNMVLKQMLICYMHQVKDTESLASQDLNVKTPIGFLSISNLLQIFSHDRATTTLYENCFPQT